MGGGAVRLLCLGTLLCALSLLQFQIIVTGVAPHIDVLGQTAGRILSGTPHAAAFQNRLLAPVAQSLIEHGTGLPTNYAFLAVIFASVILLNAVWIWWIARAASAPKRWLAYFAFSAVWVLLLDFYNFHTWDVIDLVVFSLLGFAIVEGWALRYLVVLFLIAIFNRESAILVGLWLLLSAWRAPGVVEARRLFVGTSMVATGIAVMIALRKLLLVEATAMGHIAGGTVIAFDKNWSHALAVLDHPAKAPFLVFLVVVFLVVPLLALRRLTPLDRRLAMLTIMLGFTGITFGFWTETRVFLIAAPSAALLLANVVLASGVGTESTTADQAGARGARTVRLRKDTPAKAA
jgi:hypothetical protein